jgi:tetratricopeptide (TPR) repeat protein
VFTLQLLGGLSLTGPDGRPLGRATQRKRLALLAVLARAPRRTATRDRLIGLLWPECTAEEARHRLSSALYDLRQTLGTDALISRGDDVSLARPLGVDAEQFERAAAAGSWNEAARLYSGPFLDGVHLDDAEEFERWVDGERDRLQRLWARARAAATDDALVAPSSGAVAPVPPVPPARTTSRSRPRWLAAVAAILVLAVLLGWAASRRWRASAPSDTTRVAVFPFRVLGNTPVPDLAHGVVDLLSLDLDGAGDVRVVDPDALLAGIGTDTDLAADAARSRARRLGATHYLLGTAHGEPGRIRLQATLYLVSTAEIEAQVSADGAPDHLLGLVDQLAAALLADRLHTSKERIARAGSVSTTSLPALKAWLAGELAFRRGRYVEAAESFERAASLDTSFALAHYRHSLATLWGDRPGASTDLHDAMALRHAARLAPRDRQLLEAYGAWRTGDASRAERLYRRVLATWADDLEAWHQLGETLIHYNPLRGRPVSEARSAFERVLSFDPDHRGARWHVALLDALAGRTEALRAALIRLAGNGEPTGAEALELRGMLVALRRDAPLPTEDLELASADEATLSSLVWRLAVFLGDLDAAERTARQLTGPQRNDYAKLMGRSMLAQLAMARGKLRAARAEIARAPEVGPGFDLEMMRAASSMHWWGTLPREQLSRARDTLRLNDPRLAGWAPTVRIYTVGMLDLALGDSLGLQQTVSRLESPRPDSALARDLALGLRAYHAARGGKPSQALRFLDAMGRPGWFGHVVTGAPLGDPLPRFVRAEMLFALGRDDEALAWYGTFGEHALRDLVYLAPAAFRRGQIFERQGRPDDARLSYGRVVELWSNADPELQPWVAAARARLGGRLAHQRVDARPGSLPAPSIP